MEAISRQERNELRYMKRKFEVTKERQKKKKRMKRDEDQGR